MGNTVKRMMKKKSEALAVNVRILAGSGTGGFAPGVGPGGEKKSEALAVHVEAGIISILP